MVEKSYYLPLPNSNSNGSEQQLPPPSAIAPPQPLSSPNYNPQMAAPHPSPYEPSGLNNGQPGQPPYQLPPPEQLHESQASSQYPQYSYDIQLRYPQEPNRTYPPPPTQGISLPSMSTMSMPGPGGYGGPPEVMNADTTGQIPPPGMKPRVTATLWEDEGTLCFQVDVKGTCVARREDNHMINGTKLLNVAGMTRGRRDGILKSEKMKHVVKIGPMHLKGVWIPFERALEFANKEKITELLYPLFVHNIGALLYHPINRGYPAAIPRTQEPPRQQAQPAPGMDYGPNNDYRPSVDS